MQRRQFIHSGLAGALGLYLSSHNVLSALAHTTRKPHVVVAGGGFGGATTARYIRLFSQLQIDVTLIEPNAKFVSCPMSNLVVGGVRTMADITHPRNGFRKLGIRWVKHMVQHIDAITQTVRLGDGARIPYDALVLAPGIDLLLDKIEGLRTAHHKGAALQAWKAGPETAQLRKQLELMKDGGIYAISIPLAPYRCPPGPYERACLVANYFKEQKPKSKVVVLDANPDVISKDKLFKAAWAEQYPNHLEYRPNTKVTRVDAPSKTIHFELDEPLKADVLNILPDMRAGKLAVDHDLATINQRWVDVHYQTFESKVLPNVFVVGDAIQGAPLMPKSAHMANSHGKAAAAAIVAKLLGLETNPQPVLNNTCYSYVNNKQVIHIASVHAYNPEQKTYLTVPNSGGFSNEANELEGHYAWSWAHNIWHDVLG